MSLNYQYRSGAPFSEPNGIVEEGEDEETFFRLDYQNFNQKRFPDYHRLDWSLAYHHSFSAPKLSFEAAFSIQNLFNRANVFNRKFFLSDTDEIETFPEISSIDYLLLGRTPLLLVRVWW